MATKTIEELRASFNTPTQEGNKDFSNNLYYPFWDIKVGQSCVIRFLPDLEDNPRGFLVEKTTHTLTINGEKKTVPCLSAFEEACPICKLSQDYYKVEDKINGKKYWRKKGYIAQALILEDPLPPNKDTGETHVGKVRYIALGFQLYNIIKEAFAADVEPLEAVPYNFHDGYDFIIKKSQKGDYADYSVGTKFFSKQRALTEDELATAGEGMVDLSTLLPKNPGLDRVQAMLTAELNGEQYNEKRGGNNEEFSTPKSSVQQAASVDAVKREVHLEDIRKNRDSESVKETSVESSSSDVDDMLATIRARRKAAASASASA